ncbi:MAG: hypothetical protein WBO23_19090 [Burkholderiales bacterium]
MPSLKASYSLVFGAFLLGNLAVFVALIVSPDFLEGVASGSSPWSARVMPYLTSGFVACLVALAFNAFLPAAFKHVLVFWRLRDVLPGHRAFTEFARNDPRVDLARLREKYGAFPTNGADQNRLWYRLLQKQEGHPAVAGAHARFLALRDMAASTALLAGLLTVSAVIVHTDARFYPLLLGILAIEYLMLRVGAVNEAERLVCNVLAMEGAS